MLGNKITLEHHRREPGGIPTLLSYAPGDEPHPLVLVLHGLTSSKSGNSFVPPNHFGLIEAGFAVASFDGRVHGERLAREWFDPLNGLPRGGLSAFLEVVRGTAEDAGDVLGGLSSHPMVDAGRIGAIGVSMGALVLQHLLVRDDCVGAAVLVHGGDGWGSFRGLFPGGDGAAPLEELGEDPAGLAEKFFPRPILCLNGEADPHLPPAGASAFLERLRPFYGSAPGRLEQRTYPGVGHETVEPMRRDAVAWLGRFLVG